MMKKRGKTLRAQEFVLEDVNGQTRAVMGTDTEGNTVLSFRDSAGASRLYAGLTSNGTPRIGLVYAGGKGSIQLEANDVLGSAAITLAGGGGRVQVVSAITSHGTPVLALFDEKGKLLFSSVPPPENAGGEDNNIDWDSLGRKSE